MEDKFSILKKYWGYDAFRPLQEDIIDALLRKEDVLALMPTGGGKSLCFQVPAMMLDGLCLVVSPLIALMKDQVEGLRNKGIEALAIHAGMPYREVKETLRKAAFTEIKFLYLSPERLETSLFREFLPALKPSLIAVDEAHCISQWGYDFRPPYARISALRKELPGIPVIALTASATPDVQEDICKKLAFYKNAKIFRQSFDRPNLSYSVYSPEAKEARLLEILQKVPGPAIVYCKSRKHTQQMATLLKLKGLPAEYYHAGLVHEERSARQQAWITNKTRIIVCTNAFGMGIDKPDVKTIVHFDVPDCLENYYQEAGRAGRNGEKAYAVLLFEEAELNAALMQIPIKFPDAGAVKQIYTHLMNYLQVPAGSGEMQTFDLDLPIFAQRFNLNIISAMYGLEALALGGLITLDDAYFKPSTLAFSCTKADLRAFEETHPQFVYLLKGLLRTYEGIFDYACTIYEGLLANFLKTPVNDIRQNLFQLHAYKIIEYKPATDKSQVQLLLNRMYHDDFKIDQDSINKRRERAKERLEEMHHYIHLSSECRSRFIGGYFGDGEMLNCGVCDNCLRRKKSSFLKKDMQKYRNQIITLLEKLDGKSIQLENLRNGIPDEPFMQVIDYLTEEEIIGYNKDGEVEVKKKGPR